MASTECADRPQNQTSFSASQQNPPGLPAASRFGAQRLQKTDRKNPALRLATQTPKNRAQREIALSFF
jgi:hypothetical protein